MAEPCEFVAPPPTISIALQCCGRLCLRVTRWSSLLDVRGLEASQGKRVPYHAIIVDYALGMWYTGKEKKRVSLSRDQIGILPFQTTKFHIARDVRGAFLSLTCRAVRGCVCAVCVGFVYVHCSISLHSRPCGFAESHFVDIVVWSCMHPRYQP